MQPSGPDATPLAQGYDDALAEPTRESPLPAIIQAVCSRIGTRLPRFPVPEQIAGDPVLAARWKLRGTLSPLPFPDHSGVGSTGWPGNQLTGEDIRRLNLWGRLTGLPTNRLLHVAAGIMSEHLRLQMIDLLAEQQESGIPLEQLLDGTSAPAIADAPTARPRRSRVHAAFAKSQEAADQGEKVLAATQDRLPTPPASPAEIAQLVSSPADPISLAAEPPPSGRSGRRRAKSAHDTSPACEPACSPADEPPFAEILDQLRQTRDEMRVLWEAVDELRESLEYAMRNPPEAAEPLRFQPTIDFDLAAEDLVERLNALPAEILATLREQLTAPRDDSAAALPLDAESAPQEPAEATTPAPPAQADGRMPRGQVMTELPENTEPEPDKAGTSDGRNPPPPSPPPPGSNGQHRKTPPVSPSPYRAQQRLF